MQRTLGAACRTTSRLRLFGSRSYSYEVDEDFPSKTTVVRSDTPYEKSVNKVTLIGRLGSDVRFGGDSLQYCNFRMGTNHFYTDRNTNETKQRTTWHNIKSLKPTISMKLQDVGKGSRVYIEGKLDNDDWIDKEGQKRQTINILIDELIVLQRKAKMEDAFDTKTFEDNMM
ncbi:single-stranded DNA-binding protein, mitochondrial-like [Ylistrum balloti]|uniref:single-stranded DNA-binding protein, mitochondrial-like n=1 Tax=Ylistrum balloti TaxID=509963 RepID=UPI002905B687|nr:single-stranded DNA-binding protein, mitochondrial-like [Ylistrum balloti]